MTERSELIVLILWFYFTIWLGLQMKSQPPLQKLCCECQVPAGCCEYLWAFCPFSSTRDVLGHLQEVVCHTPTANLLLSADTKLLIWPHNWCVCTEHKQPRQTPAGPDPPFPAVSQKLWRLLMFLVFQLHGNRLLISFDYVWKSNQKMQFPK